MKHSVKEWVVATRFWSFPVSAMPVIGGIGAVLAASYSFFKFRAMGDIFVFICFPSEFLP